MKIAHVDVGGAAIRYLETGDGAPLVHLVEPGALRPAPGHALLASRFRVLVMEAPPSGHLVTALARLELEAVALLATGRAASAAAALALSAPPCVRALVLESPTTPDDAVLEQRLADLRAPTLVLLGARVGGDGRRWADRLPNGYVVYVYDAGHAIASERPEAFAEVVTDFFERREAFVVSRATTVIHP